METILIIPDKSTLDVNIDRYMEFNNKKHLYWCQYIKTLDPNIVSVDLSKYPDTRVIFNSDSAKTIFILKWS